MLAFLLSIIFLNIIEKHFLSFFLNVFIVYIFCFWIGRNLIIEDGIIINQTQHTCCLSGNKMKIFQNPNGFFCRFLIIAMNRTISALTNVMKRIHYFSIIDKFADGRITEYIHKIHGLHLLIVSCEKNKLC